MSNGLSRHDDAAQTKYIYIYTNVYVASISLVEI
jgi:hypothetical protein